MPPPIGFEPDIVQQFGHTLRHQRDLRRWSQERLAATAELNRTYVGELERGEAVASLQTADKLARALGVHLSELLQEAEQRAPAPLATDAGCRL